MEPDDLSFIEISGEDDSLLPLQHIGNDDVSSLKKTDFACSPLQIPRSGCSVNPPLVSPIVGISGNEDMGELDLLLNTVSVNKENVSSNKPEVPKLNMEPQQMKRKKKGGGFNLRKSLAWNKAFFTEEGVLDPLELSMISGNSGKSGGEMLSVIEEDGRESLAGSSTDLTVYAENVFKELPAKNLREDRKSRGALLHKNGSPARVKVASASAFSGSPAGVNVASASAGKRKVLSTHDINRSQSKRSGCPRPVTSSSLKRPANGNTVKSTTKESRVTRVPPRKLDTSVHSTTTKNIIPGMSNVKRNQISQPAVSIQRNVGSKVTSNSTIRVQSDARSGSTSRSITVKSSVQLARINLTNSEMENHSLAKSQNPLGSKAKNALKTDKALPLPTSSNVSNNHDGDSRKVSISLPSHGSMKYAQIQTTKPSGLRMPSPSLGFFNQSKASSLPSLLTRSDQACNVLESNIPNFKKAGVLNATQKRFIRTPGMANGVAASNMRIPKSIKGSSIPSRLCTDSHEEVKSNLQINEIQKVGLDGPSDCNSYGILNNQQKLQSLCNDVDQEALPNLGPSETEKISHAVNNELKSNDNKLLLHIALSDQLEKDEDDDEKIAKICLSTDLTGDESENPQFSSVLQPTVQDEGFLETNDMIDSQHMEEKMCNSLIKNHATSSLLQSGDATSDTVNATLKMQDDWLGSVNGISEQSRKLDEEMMPSINQVSTEGQNPCLNNDTLSKEIRSSDFHNCETAKIADGSPEVRCCSGGAAESSRGQSPSEDMVEAKDCPASISKFRTETQVSDVEVESVHDILSAGSIESFLCSAPLDKMVVDMSENVGNANGSELKCPGALCSVQCATQDCGFHMAETEEFPNGDATNSVYTYAQLSHEIELHGLTSSVESEMIGKDQSLNTATTTIIKVSNVCPNSGLSSECELNLQQFETQPSAPEQIENGATVKAMFEAMEVQSDIIDDANEHKGLEKKTNLHGSCTELQPAENISYCQHSTSTVYDDQLSDMPMVCQQSMEENQSPKASDKLSSEDDSSYFQHSTSTLHFNQSSSMHMFSQQSVEGIQIPNVSDELWSEECMPFKESRGSCMEKVADISLDIKSPSGKVPKSPNGLLQYEHTEQRNEEITVFDSTIKKPLVEVEKMQVLEGSLLADSCKGKLHDVVEDEIPNSNQVAAHGFCLNNNLTVNNSSSEEYLDNNVCGNLMDDILEQSDGCANESNSSIICTQIAAAVREDGIDEDQKAEDDDDVQKIGVNVLKSDNLPDEASICQKDGYCEINHELENPVFATEDAAMSSSGAVFQDIEVNALISDVSPLDAETSISQKNGDPNCEMQRELEYATCHTEDQPAIECFKNSGNDKKQDNPVIKPPPDAPPFSDEWLAAFEAAGEEILTMKSGAVKHSPPDKSLPEPSPWSPVKRKNNQGIGPFDCTKFTNGNINTPPSNSTSGD